MVEIALLEGYTLAYQGCNSNTRKNTIVILCIWEGLEWRITPKMKCVAQVEGLSFSKRLTCKAFLCFECEGILWPCKAKSEIRNAFIQIMAGIAITIHPQLT